MLFQMKNTLKSNRNHTFKHAAGTTARHRYNFFFVKYLNVVSVFFFLNNKNLITRVIILILISYGKT